MSQAQIELALFDKLEAIKATLPTIYYPNSPHKNKPNPQRVNIFASMFCQSVRNLSASPPRTKQQVFCNVPCMSKTAQVQLERLRLPI